MLMSSYHLISVLPNIYTHENVSWFFVTCVHMFPIFAAKMSSIKSCNNRVVERLQSFHVLHKSSEALPILIILKGRTVEIKDLSFIVE